MRILVSSPRKWNSSINRDGRYTQPVEEWISHHLFNLARDSHFQNIVGGSSLHLGLDTVFASICIREQIPLHIILACDDQDKFWGGEERIKFDLLKAKASSITISSPGEYTEGCISKQTKALTDWVVGDSKSVLLSIRSKYQNPSPWQIERRKIIEKANGLILELKLR